MANDLEVIAQLENTIEKKLEKKLLYKIHGRPNGYALDDSGRVVGLSLAGRKKGSGK